MIHWFPKHGRARRHVYNVGRCRRRPPPPPTKNQRTASASRRRVTSTPAIWGTSDRTRRIRLTSRLRDCHSHLGHAPHRHRASPGLRRWLATGAPPQGGSLRHPATAPCATPSSPLPARPAERPVRRVGRSGGQCPTLRLPPHARKDARRAGPAASWAAAGYRRRESDDLICHDGYPPASGVAAVSWVGPGASESRGESPFCAELAAVKCVNYFNLQIDQRSGRA